MVVPCGLSSNSSACWMVYNKVYSFDHRARQDRIPPKMERPFRMTHRPTMSKKYLRTKWLIFWSLLTFVGLLLTAAYHIGRTSNGEASDILNALNSQMLRFQIWAALSVFVIVSDRVLRSKSRRWRFLFPAHLLVSFAWSAAALGIYGVLFWTFYGLINSQAPPLGHVFGMIWIANLVMGIFVYKIILTTNYALDYYKKFHEEKSRNALLQTQLAQAELHALKMQLQPHFLFNTLNSISHLALEDSKKAVQMVARLGDFLRLTIDSNGQQQVTLERELEFLTNYLEIEKIRFRDRMHVTFDIAPDTLGLYVPNMILQPFAENAIKHGLAKNMAAGRIDIKAEKDDDRLRIQLSNDGAIVSLDKPLGSNGIGIANTRARLEKLFGPDFLLDLRARKSGGATVTLEVPLATINGQVSS